MQRLAAPMDNEQSMVTPSIAVAAGRLQTPTVCLIARLEAIGEEARKKNRDDKPTPQPNAQLPLWPQTVRGVPNALLRTALFTISKDREASKPRNLLASTSDIDLRFTGERFNQTDLDVWEVLLHVARTQPLETEVRFSAYSLLKALGRGTGKAQREQLKDGIARLQGGVVEITWKKDRKTFSGQLVGNAFRDDMTQEYVVVLNEKLLGLYDDGYTHIDWTQRKALKSSLSKWLHGFFSTHDKPHPYKVATVRALCGSTTKELWKFRQMLKVALGDLVTAGFLKEWSITSADLVRVVVVFPDDQVKHINKKRVIHRRKPSTFTR
ncbi:TrfA protein [Pollutimonas bauzanensis]|uniref:TrfA protein n=2 Tax=Pollutimonas bauzanensis TaxID=658167 RepID=A0A1M5XMD3_9BURK|nr:TrfA protein [Pollutimonas bauzanensis]